MIDSDLFVLFVCERRSTIVHTLFLLCLKEHAKFRVDDPVLKVMGFLHNSRIYYQYLGIFHGRPNLFGSGLGISEAIFSSARL